MTDYGEVFWICPHCKVHIPLIGDKIKVRKKIGLHTLICVNKRFPSRAQPISLKYFLDVNQCPSRCPKCKSRCGGIEGHPEPHQCPIHYRPKTPLRKWLEKIRHDFRQDHY